MALVLSYSNTTRERHGEGVSESNLPPEQWRPYFDRADIEFGYRPLAARAGLTHTRVHRLIRGGGTTNEAIQQVADALGVKASKVRELRGEPPVEIEPFTLPDDAGRLNETERTVVRAMVRALLDARDNAHAADQPAADPPAAPEGAQDQASAREKTAAQLQAHLDALTNGDIPVANEDRTALMAKLRAGIDALQEQAQGAQVHDLADRRRKAHELRGTQDPFDDPNSEGAEWPDGTVVTDEEKSGYLQWLAARQPADFEPYRAGERNDYDLAARENDERKGSDPAGLDDGEK